MFTSFLCLIYNFNTEFFFLSMEQAPNRGRRRGGRGRGRGGRVRGDRDGAAEQNQQRARPLYRQEGHGQCLAARNAAWNQYYSLWRDMARLPPREYRLWRRENMAAPVAAADIPEHIVTALLEMANRLNEHFECSICLDMIETDHHTTKCGHFFHKACIAELLKPECPNCRQAL